MAQIWEKCAVALALSPLPCNKHQWHNAYDSVRVAQDADAATERIDRLYES